MNATFFFILKKAGYAERQKPVEFLDNWGRHFVVSEDQKVVTIAVSGGDPAKLPKLEGVFTFDLATETTNASPQQIQEIRTILEIKPFFAAD